MSLFHRLMRLLEDELLEQEKLLDVLGRERAAIVSLKQDEIDLLRQRKAELLDAATAIARKRDEVVRELLGRQAPADGVKVSDLLKQCPSPDIQGKLESIVRELRAAATAVQELNSQNAELIRQSLGLVASTIAIFRSVPEAELPVYNESGSIRDPVNSRCSSPSSTIARDA